MTDSTNFPTANPGLIRAAVTTRGVDIFLEHATVILHDNLAKAS